MSLPAQCWIVTLEHQADGEVHGLLTICGSTTLGEPESYEFCGSSSTLFQELATVLDATMFTHLAIADQKLPEGTMPLL